MMLQSPIRCTLIDFDDFGGKCQRRPDKFAGESVKTGTLSIPSLS